MLRFDNRLDPFHIEKFTNGVLILVVKQSFCILMKYSVCNFIFATFSPVPDINRNVFCCHLFFLIAYLLDTIHHF